MAWHDATCAALKLEWEEDGRRPGCLTCQRKAPALAPIHPISPPGPPPDVPRSQLLCTWPPQLFSDDSLAESRKVAGDLDHDRLPKAHSDGPDYVDTPEDAKNSTQHDIDNDHSAALAFVGASIDAWTSNNTTSQSGVSLESNKKGQEQTHSSSELATTFQKVYTSLPNTDSIRLLRLHGSATRSDPIHCNLLVHGLHDPCRPTFEAFSYTWADSQGDSSLCETIFVGPQYDILPVTKNCLAALRCFRTSVDRLVWVDATCINQFDLDERGRQVSLMRDIYKSAARVLTYLGEWNEDLGDVTESPHYNHERSDHPSGSAFADVSMILCLPYFSRIWVIQEVMLANSATMSVGKHTTHWKDFRDLVQNSLSSQQKKPVSALIEHFNYKDGEMDLLSWLKGTKDSRCGDLRDRVYGLMGLVSEKDRRKLPVDYSISKQQLYTGLAMYWLTGTTRDREQISTVLKMALLPKMTLLPSWTPDWTPQPHISMNRECTSLTPLTLQFDTTFVERPSSGLPWPRMYDHGMTKPSVRWTLDEAFQGRRDNFNMLPPLYKLTTASGWRQGSVKPLPLSGTLALEVVHILSISAGRLELTDTNGRSLHGLQLTRSRDCQSRQQDLSHDDTHLYICLDWQEPLALKKHADAVYSLHDKFSIVCAPLGADIPSNSRCVFTIERHLQRFETDILEEWIMDLFFYGIKAGSAYADLLEGSKMNARWSQCFPHASAACEVLNLPFKIHAEEDYRCPTIAEMIGISEDARDFVDKDKGPWESGSSSESLELNPDPRDSHGPPLWPCYYWRASDESLTRRIQKAHAASLETASSPEELWTHLRSVVGECRDSCKDYVPLQQAMSDLEDKVNERLSDRGYGHLEFDLLQLLAPHSARIGAKGIALFSKVDCTITNIVCVAWALLQELKIDPKFTLEQNFSILWIHVLTVEMVARLRGCLQQRLILNAISDKMRHPEKIYLI